MSHKLWHSFIHEFKYKFNESLSSNLTYDTEARNIYIFQFAPDFNEFYFKFMNIFFYNFQKLLALFEFVRQDRENKKNIILIKNMDIN